LSNSKIQLIERSQIISFQLKQDTKYANPFFQFRIEALANESDKADISYFTRGINFYIMYEAVLKNDIMSITPWAVIDNNSGKDFLQAKIKLLIGDVNTLDQYGKYGCDSGDQIGTPLKVDMNSVRKMKVMPGAFTAEYGSGLENQDNDNDKNEDYKNDSFSSSSSNSKSEKVGDYKVFFLQDKYDLRDESSLKLKIDEPKNLKYSKQYQYNVFDKIVYCRIMINKEELEKIESLSNGLIKMYGSNSQSQLEFIGEQIFNYNKILDNEGLLIGKTTDIIARTKVMKEKASSSDNRKEIHLELENKTDKEVELQIDHEIGSINWDITDNNFKYEKNGTRAIKIMQKIPAKTKITLKWYQRVK
jgi:hypothetical protein